jgi:DNA repair protein RadC
LHIREIRVLYQDGIEWTPKEAGKIMRPSEAVSAMAQLFDSETVELSYALFLDTALHPIGYHLLSRGTLNDVAMHPREVFKAAILANAAGIVLIHNHPSGNTEPSAYDIKTTTRLRQVGELVGIEVMDHIILGANGQYRSLRELADDLRRVKRCEEKKTDETKA